MYSRSDQICKKSHQMCSAQWLPPHSLSPLKSHSGVLIQGLFVLFNNKFLILFLNCHRLVSNITAIRWVRKTRRQSKALASVTLLSPRWPLSRFILHTWHSWQRGRKVIYLERHWGFSWDLETWNVTFDERHQSGKKIPSKVFVQYHQKLPSKDEQTLISEILTLLMSLQSWLRRPASSP